MAQGGGLTFLFTDIEGSTRLVDELQEGWGLTLRTCRRMVLNVLEQHGGREFGAEGDGQFFVFSSPEDAAIAAIATEQKVSSTEWPGEVDLRIRIAIHCGPVRVSGGEYIGRTIHEVARISSAANGGQILASLEVARALRRSEAVDVVSLGIYALRGLPEPRELFGITAPGRPGLAVPPRAARAGGRPITIWQREVSEPVPAARPDAPASPRIDWLALVPGVEVRIDTTKSDTADTTSVRVTVLHGGEVVEEYDGLSIDGQSGVARVVNTWSRLVKITVE